jgi:hypothetical protein
MSLNERKNKIRDSYRDVTKFKKGCQPRNSLLMDERCDLLADPHKIVNRWKNYFCQLLNVQGASGVRQTEIQTAETSVPDPAPLRLKMLLESSKHIS